MNQIGRLALTVAAFALFGGAASTQNASDQLTLQLSDPSRPGTLKVSLFRGAITVTGANRRDVVVNTRATRNLTREAPPDASGLRRLSQPGRLNADEDNNVVTIGGGMDRGDLDVQVPVRTNLRLSTVNGGTIVVDGVDGEIEVNNINGSITLTGVSGSVVAHATNGKVVAAVKQVAAQKPMSFTSFNGNIDVTLPPDVKANLKLRSDRGEIYTDFDVQMQAGSKPTVSDSRSGGRYRVEFDNGISGAINGGGPEFELRTFKGDIYLRKAK